MTRESALRGSVVNLSKDIDELHNRSESLRAKTKEVVTKAKESFDSEHDNFLTSEYLTLATSVALL